MQVPTQDRCCWPQPKQLLNRSELTKPVNMNSWLQHEEERTCHTTIHDFPKMLIFSNRSLDSLQIFHELQHKRTILRAISPVEHLKIDLTPESKLRSFQHDLWLIKKIKKHLAHCLLSIAVKLKDLIGHLIRCFKKSPWISWFPWWLDICSY